MGKGPSTDVKFALINYCLQSRGVAVLGEGQEVFLPRSLLMSSLVFIMP